MTRRILAVMVSIVLAVVGTAAVFLYVRNADARAIAGQKARTIIAADKRIPAGTSGKSLRLNGYIRKITVPASTVPDEALDTIGADLDALVVTADVQKGQLLLRPMFGSETSAVGGLRIPEGKVAIAAKVKNATFGPGQMKPGARVAIFYSYTPLDDAHRNTVSGDGLEGGHTTNNVTRLLLTDVEVVAVGTVTSDTRAGGAGGTNEETVVTFAVTQVDAERLAHAVALGGEINVALLSDDSNVKPDNGIDNRSLF